MTATDVPISAGGLTAALAEVQASLPFIEKDSHVNAGSRSYDYADLAVITPKILPRLSENGLAWMAKPTFDENQNFVLRYQLRHVSGEVEQGDYPLPDPSSAKPQDIGSAITYARRYALCSVVGLAPGGEDDDAQQAQKEAAASPRKAKAAPAKAAATPAAKPTESFQPTAEGTARLTRVLGQDPTGLQLDQWMWQLASETDESLDAVPWDKIAKVSGITVPHMVEQCRVIAAEKGLAEPGQINDVYGPLAQELRDYILGQFAPF